MSFVKIKSLVLKKMCCTDAVPSISLTDGDIGLITPTGSALKPIYTPPSVGGGGHNLCQWFRSKDVSVLFASSIKRVSKLPQYQLVIISSSADFQTVWTRPDLNLIFMVLIVSLE